MMQDTICMIIYLYRHLHISRTLVQAQITPINWSWFPIAQTMPFKVVCLPTQNYTENGPIDLQSLVTRKDLQEVFRQYDAPE